MDEQGIDKAEPVFHWDERAGEHPDGSLGRWMEHLEADRRREREVLERLLAEQVAEQRKGRVARNWFRGFIAVYLILLLVVGSADLWQGKVDKKAGFAGKPHTAVVEVRGTIMPDKDAGADKVVEALTEAFKHQNTRGVVLRISSPGGSPVQAGRIYDEIIRLRKLYPNIPLYAVLEDLCASGGYYVASAAQEIYADKATLVGSIGVIMRSFGFPQAMRRLGIESRRLTAGEFKGFLDPFEPVNDKEQAHAKVLLEKIHQQFIQAVKDGRGKRLKAADDTLFSGLIWTGEEAAGLGLVDGFGTTEWVAREMVKAERLVNFSQEKDWFNRVSKRWLSQLLVESEGWAGPLLQ